MIIREAQLADADGIADVLRQIAELARVVPTEKPAAVARVSRQLSTALASGQSTVWVALSAAGAVAGYCSAHWVPFLFMPGCEGYISELFLAPTARGGGMGAALLQAAEAEARRRGCARLGLLNDRDRESYQRHFYAKHGWTERPTMASFVRPLPGTPDIA